MINIFNSIKHTAAVILAQVLITVIYGVYLYAAQPVDIISKNPSLYQVKQGAGQCGPASFYIVFRYYGDDRREYMFSKGTDGAVFRMGIDYLPHDASVGNGKSSPVIIKKNSSVSKWMNGKNNSTGWGELTGAIKNLYYIKDNNLRERFYTVIEYDDRESVSGGKNLQDRKKIFYDKIVSRFLNRNRPVIIHLKRKWPYPGHYIVLIGYDPVSATVFYLNPNNDGGEVIKTISADEFIGSYWYEANPELRWGKACWNGQWIGFYRD
ncbi:MAG TPA: C39 family peptidase [Spirochaetota bacterium]|nr:C39 family peptidase [Spirochaetota bacterium]